MYNYKLAATVREEETKKGVWPHYNTGNVNRWN